MPDTQQQWMGKDALDALVSDLKQYVAAKKPVLEIPNFQSLPPVGVAETIYVIKDTFESYYWDDDHLRYVPITPKFDGYVLNGVTTE